MMAAYFIFSHKVTDADKLNNDYLPKTVAVLKPFSPDYQAITITNLRHEVTDGRAVLCDSFNPSSI